MKTILAAHMVGDYVLQTRWQASGKFAPPAGHRGRRHDTAESFNLRFRHVTAYCVPFVPIVVVYSHGPWPAAACMAWLFLLHFLTDRQRFTSRPGEWIAWHFLGADPTPPEKRGIYAAMGADTTRFDLPPNPWAPLPLLIDQSLHLAQLAVLGAVFLR